MAIHYTVTFPDAGNHRFHVAVSLPAGCTELAFPSWAPGSYLMREFARNVRDIYAHAAGAPVEVERTSRNTWRVLTDGPCVVEYDVYGREKSVRTPFLDPDLAFFLPSNLLVYAPDAPNIGFTLEVEIPAGHRGICTLGPDVLGPARAVWTAPDVDTLMDAPVSVGPFEHRSIEVRGVTHHHAIEPGHNGDCDRMMADLGKIVATAADLFGGDFPYPAYRFVTLHQKGGHGGLEHNDGCILLRPRRSFAEPKDYEEFVTLAAHEHFHAWNVKRIRPDTLGPPFDYRREHYTRDLWWLEGGTVYYEERIAYKAGLVSAQRHVERLADLAQKLRDVPGRRHQSLEDSSFDTWIKLYRPGEDSVNSTVSYYLKGAVVIWAMDLEILQRTDGAASADTLLRRLWDDYARHGLPYPEGRLRALAAEIAGGGDWDRWWDQHIRGTAEVALAEALDHVGYDLQWAEPARGGWLGLDVADGDRVVVRAVRENGPCASVIAPEDELLALDGERVLGSTLGSLLKEQAPGRAVNLLISRDHRIRNVTVTLGSPPRNGLKVVPRAAPTAQAARLRSIWLGDGINAKQST